MLNRTEKLPKTHILYAIHARPLIAAVPAPSFG